MVGWEDRIVEGYDFDYSICCDHRGHLLALAEGDVALRRWGNPDYYDPLIPQGILELGAWKLV